MREHEEEHSRLPCEIVSILMELFSPYIEAAMREVELFFTTGHLVHRLGEQTAKLAAARDGVRMELEKAELEGATCEPSVALWIKRVAESEEELIAVERDYERRQTCFGDLSFDLAATYDISKRADERLKTVEELLKEQSKFEGVAKSGVPSRGKELPVPATIVGMDDSVDAAIRFLAGGDGRPTAGVLAILGMGGGGKSILLKAINNQLIRSPSFDRVVFVDASSSSETKAKTEELQEEIAKQLGLKSGRDAEAITAFLKDKSFLILLDNLWEAVDLDDLGVPRPVEGITGERGRRRMVAFTTRSDGVCSGMAAAVLAKEIIKLGRLDDDKSWTLFRENAGRDLLDSNTRIRRLAEEICRRCDGLPLAIVATAKAMSSKKTYKQWDYVAKQLRQSATAVSDIESSFLQVLKVSYDNLADDTTKQCFLLCSLWSKGEAIPKEELIKCWMGMDLLGGSGDFDEAYYKGHAIIGGLVAAGLLEPSEAEEEEAVKMQSLVRDMALWVASDCGKHPNKWVVRTGDADLTELPDESGEAELLAIGSCNIAQLVEPAPKCRHLKALIAGDNMLDTVPGSYMKNMSSLTFLDLSGTFLEEVPAEICCLTALLHLDLSSTAINTLPEELGELKNLNYLYLKKTRNLNEIPRGAISRLWKLRVLDASDSGFQSWSEAMMEELAELSKHGSLKAVQLAAAVESTLDELAGMSSSGGVPVRGIQITASGAAEDGSFRLPPSAFGSKGQKRLVSMAFQDSNEVEELVFGAKGGKYQSFPHLEELVLAGNGGLRRVVFRGVEPQDFLQRLQHLRIEDCNCLVDVGWITKLPHLEELTISGCDELVRLFGGGRGQDGLHEEDDDEEDGNGSLQALERLEITNLPKLEYISGERWSFPALKHIYVAMCPALRSVPKGLSRSPYLRSYFVEDEPPEMDDSGGKKANGNSGGDEFEN